MQHKHSMHILAVAGFIFAFSVVLLAAQQTTTRSRTTVSEDEEFATKAASGGLAEVKLGQLASERGSNPAVKEFGERMVTDHSKANDELKSVALRENITLPSSPLHSEQATYDRLSRLAGKEFDDAYASAMVKDHEEDIAEFQRESSDGKNSSLRSFASKTLPTLQSHLQQAKEMAKSVRASQ